MSVASEQRGDFARHDFGRTPTITSRPELRGSFGMIATTHWVATGVGMGMTPQRWLHEGDVVELGIEKLGRQRHKVIAWNDGR